MRKIALSKILIAIICFYTLAVRPQIVLAGTQPVSGLNNAAKEVYTARIIRGAFGEEEEISSDVAQLYFIATKGDRDDVSELKGIFIGQIYIGVKGLLHRVHKSKISLDDISIKVDEETVGQAASHNAHTIDLFSGLSDTPNAVPPSLQNWTNLQANVGLPIGNLANQSSLITSVNLGGGLNGATTLAHYNGSDFMTTSDKIFDSFPGYFHFLIQIDNDGGNGRRLVKGTTVVDATLDSGVAGSALVPTTSTSRFNTTLQSGSRASCLRDWNEVFGSLTSGGECPYYMVNFLSQLVDVNEVINPSTTSVTLEMTTALLAPVVLDGDFTDAPMTYSQKNDHLNAHD